MTVLSLERLHLRPAGTPFTARVRDGFDAWSALVARSRQAALDYDRAGSTSARQQVLASFVDAGA